MSRIRTFLAFDIAEELKEELYMLITSYKHYKNINWIEKENLHITIRFIGDTEYHHLEKLNNIFLDSFEKVESFKISKVEIEIIPYKNPRIIWLKLSTDSPFVLPAIKKLRNNIKGLGYSLKNQSINLHITLGKIKKRLSPDFFSRILSEKIVSIPSPVNKIIFYESVLKKTGARYFPIRTYNLLPVGGYGYNP